LREQEKFNAIRGQNEPKTGFDRSVDRPVEFHLGLCLQQNVLGGWGSTKSLPSGKNFVVKPMALGVLFQ